MSSSLLNAFKYLPQAARNPYAFIAYLAVIIAWVIIALRIKRNRQLLEKIQNFPEEQRRDLILAEMGSPVPPDLSAEQWVKSRRQLYFFYAFLSLVAAAVVVFTIAVVRPSPSAVVRETLEQILTVPIDEYISLDYQLQRLAKEQGKTPQQLKDEIDNWMNQIKTPYEEGLAALYRGDYPKAQNYLRESIEASKQELAQNYFYLGNAEFGNKQYDKAIVDYQEAISINLESAESHTNLGGAYNSIGQYDKAISVVEKAIRLKPNYPWAYRNLSYALNKTGQYEESIKRLKRAIELYSVVADFAPVHNNLGVAYRNIGKYDQAEAALQRATKLDPDLAMAHHNLGNVYTNQKMYNDAIEEFQKAIQLDSTLAEAIKNLGLLYYWAQGQYEKGIEWLKKAVTLAPSFTAAHYDLGNMFFKNQQYDKAITEYQETVRLDPEHFRAHYQLACTYSLEKQPEDALESLKKAISLNAEYIDHAKTDPDLVNIRETKEFQDFVHREG